MISSSFKECFSPGTFSQPGARNPLPASENAALVSGVAQTKNDNVCDGVLSCVTLSHMAKHISIRLWDDVLAAVDKLAVVEERDRSQVINRTLRQALCVTDWNMSPAAVKAGHVATEAEAIAKWGPREVWKGTLVPKSGTRVLDTFEKNTGKRRKACQHGNDPLSCKMPACRQARG